MILNQGSAFLAWVGVHQEVGRLTVPPFQSPLDDHARRDSKPSGDIRPPPSRTGSPRVTGLNQFRRLVLRLRQDELLNVAESSSSMCPLMCLLLCASSARPCRDQPLSIEVLLCGWCQRVWSPGLCLSLGRGPHPCGSLDERRRRGRGGTERDEEAVRSLGSGAAACREVAILFSERGSRQDWSRAGRLRPGHLWRCMLDWRLFPP